MMAAVDQPRDVISRAITFLLSNLEAVILGAHCTRVSYPLCTTRQVHSNDLRVQVLLCLSDVDVGLAAGCDTWITAKQMDVHYPRAGAVTVAAAESR
jgi:hypothetical protein